jgi:SARP family transcriptional regulator, regulator of embCAB operon
MGTGPALSGLSRGPVVEAYAVDLDEQRKHAQHMCIQAEMSCGRHADLVNELRALTVRHPLDEGFHQFLIEALTRLGRRAEALGAYQDLRRTLQDELGLDPSRAARSLQAELLRG